MAEGRYVPPLSAIIVFRVRPTYTGTSALVKIASAFVHELPTPPSAIARAATLLEVCCSPSASVHSSSLVSSAAGRACHTHA